MSRYKHLMKWTGLLLLLSALPLSACTPRAAGPSPSMPSSPAAEQHGHLAGSPTPPIQGVAGQSASTTSQPAVSLATLPKGVPAADAACRVPSKPVACPVNNRQETVVVLVKSLAREATERDKALSTLESCDAFPRGLIRALRAELAPVACGDVLTVPMLERARPGEIRQDIRDALVGLTLAARLKRLTGEPPKLTAPFHKDTFLRFMKEQLMPWLRDRATAIQVLSLQGSRLHGYGQGIVAVEAGIADMQFVKIAREVPLPVELAKDAELRDAYYGSLDDSLGPRKRRGRDAALLGLLRLREAGVLHDQRVSRARALLSTLYNGRRINALDGLLVPPMKPLAAPGNTSGAASEQFVVSRVPAFYAPLLAPDLDITSSRALRAVLSRGLAPVFRRRIVGAKLDDDVRRLLARGLFEFGRMYWSRDDFARAAELTANDKDEPSRLIRGLSTALRDGPADATAMMLTPPGAPGKLGATQLLDDLSKGGTNMSGMAAFDAGYLLQLALVHPSDRGWWRSVGKRFDRAARLLKDAAQRRRALDRAKAARATARSIQ